MKLRLATALSLLAFSAGCHSQPTLGTLTGSLIFSSPDQPDEVTQPDAGVVQISFGQVSVGSAATLTLDVASIGTEVTLGAVTALQANGEFSLPFAPGTLVQGAPSQITVTFAPSSPGEKSAEYLLTDDGTGVETVLFELSGEGAVHGLSAAPNPIDFGEVEVDESQLVALTLTNVSQLAENLVLPPLQGTQATSFSLGTPSATALAPGDSATLNVVFAPLDLGGASASLTISAGPGIFPVTVNLGGIGVTAWLSVTPALDFGFVQVGDTWVRSASIENGSSYKTFYLEPPGPIAFQPSGTGFSVGSHAPVAPAAIPPGQSLAVPVSFTPPSLDAFTGTLLLTTDDPANLTPGVQLQGYGGGPHISCMPELNFGPVPAGATVSADSICINDGTTIPSHADLVLQIAQSDLGTDNPAFVPNLVLPDGGLAGSGYSVSLSPGELTKVRVGFRPADAGLFRDWLAVSSNDIDDVDAGTLLLAQGFSPGSCNLSAVPQELGFGEVPSGGLGILQFELSNVGGDLCFITQVALDPDSDPAFWLPDGPPGSQLLSFPGETDHPELSPSVTLEVGFSPGTSQAAASGKIDILTFDGAPAGQSIALTGSSQSACLSVQPPRIDFGPVGLNATTQQICAAADAGFTIVNGCGMPVTVSQVALDSGLDAVPQFALQESLQLPLTIAAGGKANFEVGFAPTSAGAKAETISVLSSEFSGEPLLVTLEGDAESTGTRTDTFTAPVVTNQVDVLWVLDDDNDQTQLQNISSMLPQLINAMNADQIDYQMAVTSTDTCEAGNSDRGAFEPCEHCLSNAGPDPEFITPMTSNIAQSLTFLFDVFAAYPGPSLCGPLNGDKHFFDAIADALSFPLLSGHNSGFIRNGAYLAVIVVNGNAEDDGAGCGSDSSCSASTAGPYLTSLAQVVTDVQSVKADPRMASVSYVNSGAGTPDADQKIGQLVADTGGIVIDTTAPAAIWQASFLDLFPSTEGDRFHLSSTLGSISQVQVEVDGVATLDWIYDRLTNDILLTTYNLAPVWATVTVTYSEGCP